MRFCEQLIKKCFSLINSFTSIFTIRIIRGTLTVEKEGRKEVNTYDYARMVALRLIAQEIKEKGLVGNVAELGVYRGEFASRINKEFPDKTLYLFDTFEGFDEKDISVEKENLYSDGSEDFSRTTVDLVLKQMKYPHQCCVVKGYFPKSIAMLHEEERENLQFCFVSIDVDLYQPIYEGLCFFYPRLCKGGQILVHDYNSVTYKGVKNAVRRFSNETNVAFVPLPDVHGSVVITKI